MFNTDRGIRRKRDFTHAIRKKKMSDREYHGVLDVEDRHSPSALFDGTIYTHSIYKNIHQYSKNKVHCSCWMCQLRSGVNNSARNYRASDRRKLDRMQSEMIEELA
jgi:hypothetical protein